MLLHHADLPEPVLVVLPPERPQRRSVAVCAPDRRVANDPTALVQQPVAEFVVLVPDHLLVEAEPSIDFAPAEAHVDGIDVLLCGRVVEASTTDAERRARGE